MPANHDATAAGRLTDVPGAAVGHWTDAEARTGCTVIVVPDGTVASGEVRGGAPASREFALLGPSRTVPTIDAIVLTGGSAFGLAAADGVMAFLEEAGRGYVTPAGRVPIVPALGLYDLAVGDPSIRPTAANGRAAARAATCDGHDVGPIGAGCGCTVDKLRGENHIRPGGLVAASGRVGDAVVATLIALNAAGSPGAPASMPEPEATRAVFGANTTIGVVATTARLDKTECHLLAQSAHDGLARAVFPSHTRFDGDAFIAAATGSDANPGIDALRSATITIVEKAIGSLR